MPCERSVVGTLWSLTARLAETRQTLRPASSHAFEGLRAGHLVHEMTIDVEQRRAVVFGADDVLVPELVVERSFRPPVSLAWRSARPGAAPAPV